MSESALVRAIMLHYGRTPGLRLWRNNCGAFKDSHGNWIKYGVANPGGSDLIGWKDGRFVALEVKVKPRKPTPEQVAFILAADKANCIAGVVYSLEDCHALLGPP